MPNLCNDRCQWAGSVGTRECCSGERVRQFIREVQRDREPTGSLELHERIGSRKGPKYIRRILVGETSGPERRARADWESVRKRAG